MNNRYAFVPPWYAKRVRDPVAFRQICNEIEARVARATSLEPALGPMEILGVELGGHVDALMAAAALSSPIEGESANAEILAVALTNSLGRFLFAGIKSTGDAAARIHLINQRLLLWAEAELKEPTS